MNKTSSDLRPASYYLPPADPWDPQLPGEVWYLVLDTETTGLPQFPEGYPKGSFFPPWWVSPYDTARPIEVAWKVMDKYGLEVPSFEFSGLVRPVFPALGEPGCAMDPHAEALHGLSAEEVQRAELTTGAMLTVLVQTVCALRSKGEVYLVGHNVAFDFHILLAEAYRLYHLAAVRELMTLPVRCTMLEGTAACALPRPGNRAGCKWPTLDELARHFGVEGEGERGGEGEREGEGEGERRQRHRALEDVRLTARCLSYLIWARMRASGKEPEGWLDLEWTKADGWRPTPGERADGGGKYTKVVYPSAEAEAAQEG